MHNHSRLDLKSVSFKGKLCWCNLFASSISSFSHTIFLLPLSLCDEMSSIDEGIQAYISIIIISPCFEARCLRREWRKHVIVCLYWSRILYHLLLTSRLNGDSQTRGGEHSVILSLCVRSLDGEHFSNYILPSSFIVCLISPMLSKGKGRDVKSRDNNNHEDKEERFVLFLPIILPQSCAHEEGKKTHLLPQFVYVSGVFK